MTRSLKRKRVVSFLNLSALPAGGVHFDYTPDYNDQSQGDDSAKNYDCPFPLPTFSLVLFQLLLLSRTSIFLIVHNVPSLSMLVQTLSFLSRKASRSRRSVRVRVLRKRTLENSGLSISMETS